MHIATVWMIGVPTLKEMSFSVLATFVDHGNFIQ